MIFATSNNFVIVWMMCTNTPWSGKSMILLVDLDLQKIHLHGFMYTTWKKFIIMIIIIRFGIDPGIYNTSIAATSNNLIMIVWMVIMNMPWSGKSMILLVDLDLQKMYTIWTHVGFIHWQMLFECLFLYKCSSVTCDLSMHSGTSSSYLTAFFLVEI